MTWGSSAQGVAFTIPGVVPWHGLSRSMLERLRELAADLRMVLLTSG